jgi:uncharacterized protein with FMN-binding domain
VIVGVADPAIAGRTDTGGASTVQQTAAEPTTTTDTSTDTSTEAATDADASCASGDEVTGDSVMTQWGPVQVVATVDGQQVCEVHAVTWPANDRKSQAINSYAIPQLDSMASQSGTAFDYVSGATYTSEAYRESLQSILDAL